MIEVLALQSLTAQAREDEAAALLLLDQALRRAEQEGQVRVFARHGGLILPLVRSLAEGPGASPHARLVLKACLATLASAPGHETAQAQESSRPERRRRVTQRA